MLTIIFLTLLISCNKSENSKFGSVYFSYGGLTVVRSIYINNKYEMNILQENIDHKTIMISCLLNKLESQTLDSLLISIPKENISTDIDKFTSDVNGYALLVYYNESDSVKIEILGRSFREDEKNICAVCTYLNKLIDQKIQSIGSKEFKTRTSNFIIPEPPTEPLKFLFE